MSFLIPVERLIETPTVLAFHHPKPSYPLHVLIVPKAGIRSMLDITSDHSAILTEIFEVVGKLVREFKLEERGYRLITNGGAYQDVQQLHFHLISEQ